MAPCKGNRVLHFYALYLTVHVRSHFGLEHGGLALHGALQSAVDDILIAFRFDPSTLHVVSCIQRRETNPLAGLAMMSNRCSV